MRCTAHAGLMEQSHQLRYTPDSDLDTTGNLEGTMMGKEQEETSATVLNPKKRFRPKLKTTKSFPPYNQCIGGLGDNRELDSEAEKTSSDAFQGERHTREDNLEDSVGAEAGTEIGLIPRCTNREVKLKWQWRKKEKRHEEDNDGCERGRWNWKKGLKEPSKQLKADGRKAEGKTPGGRFDKEDMRTCPTEGGNRRREETLEGKEEDVEEQLDLMEGSMAPPWSSPHPILSKLLTSSSTSSSCSSISFSSAESDDVFSEGEDAASQRKTLRRTHSWRTFLTTMHWSLGRQKSWVQLAGHQGNFQLSKGGEVLKLFSEVEATCLGTLMRDPLRPFVPQYHGTITRGEHCYIRLEDLLSGLKKPAIMDCKMGVRTYQEEEVIRSHSKATLRSDLYLKMMKTDPSAPSPEEHAQRGVTKLRYLQWKDTVSSTLALGFRIEGIMKEDGSIQRDFRRVQTVAQVTEALLCFTGRRLHTLRAYHSRLLTLSDALMNSPFFRSHEVIGSSLLFVNDHNKANVWMIDFGKTTPLPDSDELRHNVPWVEGNREDGYLIGLTSLISSLSQAITLASRQQQDSCQEEEPVTQNGGLCH